jgi:hypothetical protein
MNHQVASIRGSILIFGSVGDLIFFLHRLIWFSYRTRSNRCSTTSDVSARDFGWEFGWRAESTLGKVCLTGPETV